MAESASDPRLGTILEGRYRVAEWIAEGAMGEVYRGERVQLGRAVAIKFLRAPFATEAEFLQRFEREARAMSRLSHPHCVSVIDFGVADVPYVVMEYVTGTSLSEVLERGRLPAARATPIVRQVLAALAHAHGQDIVHRDIKAANVMLTEATGTGEHVKLLDFGLAKLRDQSSDLSSAHIVVGTPSYMSPEQSLAQPADARSDVYSVGILLFELLTGEKPFQADQTFDLLRMHRDDPVPSIREVCPDARVSAELEAVIARALAKDPDDRFQSAIEFSSALDEIGATGSVVMPAELPFARTEAMDSARPPRRSRWLSMLVVVVALTAGGVLYARIALDDDRPGERAEAAAPEIAADDPEVPTMVFEVEDAARIDDGGVAPVADAALADAAPADAAVADAGLADAAGADANLLDDDAPIEELLPPEEQDEPVAAVPEEAGEPTVTDAPPESAEPVVPTTRVVRNLTDVKALIAEGKRGEAIRGLRKLRREMPRSAYVPYLLGNLYFERTWWTDGIKSYREAIKINRVYRKKVTLNKNLIRALGSNKTSGKAIWTFKNMIGWAAVPHLRRAAKHDKSRVVRSRAAAVIKQITRKKSRRRRR